MVFCNPLRCDFFVREYSRVTLWMSLSCLRLQGEGAVYPKWGHGRLGASLQWCRFGHFAEVSFRVRRTELFHSVRWMTLALIFDSPACLKRKWCRTCPPMPYYTPATVSLHGVLQFPPRRTRLVSVPCPFFHIRASKNALIPKEGKITRT